MKHLTIYFALLATLLSSCSPSMHVYSDQDKEADIADYKTYNWLTAQEIEGKGMNPLFYNELNDKRIKVAVNEQLKNRGFLYKSDKEPLQMHYHIIIEDKTVLVNEPLGYIYGPSWQMKKAQAYPYREGTLIIDLMDTKNKTLVWRGWATGAIEDEVSKKPEQAIQKAVEKIFKLFPYERR